MPSLASQVETLNTPCLNQHGFLSLPDAQQKVEAWRPDHNRVRLHSSRGIRKIHSAGQVIARTAVMALNCIVSSA